MQIDPMTFTEFLLANGDENLAKHPHISEFPKISRIWKSIPSQLARENKKFMYKVVKEGARAREYEDALQWLVDARLVHADIAGKNDT